MSSRFEKLDLSGRDGLRRRSPRDEDSDEEPAGRRAEWCCGDLGPTALKQMQEPNIKSIILANPNVFLLPRTNGSALEVNSMRFRSIGKKLTSYEEKTLMEELTLRNVQARPKSVKSKCGVPEQWTPMVSRPHIFADRQTLDVIAGRQVHNANSREYCDNDFTL